ncbi:MAG TPA: MoaD/ThiS family protein [Oscillospiraceae bacterium]|nr:MoaD/ThiS family protein [Oscillospiraceae bacterium]
MKIKVKYFGLAAEVLKPIPASLIIAESTTIGQLLEQLSKHQDQSTIDALRAATFLVNKEKATRDTILLEGDEVLVMLRLAGG